MRRSWCDFPRDFIASTIACESSWCPASYNFLNFQTSNINHKAWAIFHSLPIALHIFPEGWYARRWEWMAAHVHGVRVPVHVRCALRLIVRGPWGASSFVSIGMGSIMGPYLWRVRPSYHPRCGEGIIFPKVLRIRGWNRRRG